MMKKMTLCVFILSTLGSVSAFAENACDESPAVDFAVAYMKGLTQGVGYTGDNAAPAGPSVNELCNSLKGYSIDVSTKAGYSTVNLSFSGQRCSMNVKLASDGRVAANDALICQAQ